MPSFAAALGLRSESSVPNYAAHFLIFGFVWTIFTAARILKQIYGIDNNVAPRDDVATLGEQAVKEGKLTRSQLNRVKRNEAAHANAHEAFPGFAAAVLMATIAKVPNVKINRACAVWCVARVAYHFVYLSIERGSISQLRGILFWTANFACISLLWQSATALA